jgi:DNA repair protein RecN (Recombination protein N)
MERIASTTQVICITHIPQVAAYSDHHLFISKEVKDGRTFANIKELTGQERTLEIATMISGEKVSDASIRSAEELLKIKPDTLF